MSSGEDFGEDENTSELAVCGFTKLMRAVGKTHEVLALHITNFVLTRS
jgi:hypothetical protein